MSEYTYKATDPSGKIVKGVIEASEEKAAVSRLQNMGYIPMRIALAGKEGRRFDFFLSLNISSIFQGVSTKDVVIFTQDLSALLEAGLPVDRALHILIDVVEKAKFKEILKDILKTVQGGSYLSDALAKYPKVFSKFYTNMVKAGEAGGILENVLKRLSLFLENSQDLKDYIKSAMVYPVFLVLVGGISIIILLTFVLPKFSIIFSDMGQAIPLSTRALLWFSDMLRIYWWLILGGLAAAFYFLRRYVNTPAGRLKFDYYKLNSPIIGGLVEKIEVARFARTLGTLTKSGVPILRALNLVKDIITNKVIVNSMGDVSERVKGGERLSKPLNDKRVFPPLAVQMITVGEETGRLDEMLIRVAENYEMIVKNMVKRLISFLEPAMILFMGLMVGFIVISMLMAIFSMNEMPF
ncbi:MAG TPA: type II secretion system inner membrane protein GspF [Desulfobacteraceae bacterium]|nr:type II secretion system inner membrane protein GspF [Desulfobacteraceae bacterium]